MEQENGEMRGIKFRDKNKPSYYEERENHLLHGEWWGNNLEELDDEHVYNLVWHLIRDRGSITELKIILKENRRRKQKHPLDGILHDEFRQGYNCKYEEKHNV